MLDHLFNESDKAHVKFMLWKFQHIRPCQCRVFSILGPSYHEYILLSYTNIELTEPLSRYHPITRIRSSWGETAWCHLRMILCRRCFILHYSVLLRCRNILVSVLFFSVIFHDTDQSMKKDQMHPPQQRGIRSPNPRPIAWSPRTSSTITRIPLGLLNLFKDTNSDNTETCLTIAVRED